MKKKTGPKVLLLDIETSPKTAYVWGLWKNNVSMKQLIQDCYVLNWAAKWHGEDEVIWDALFRHKEYAKDPTDDSAIMETMHSLLEEADYVVGHNGDGFDLPTLNARFIKHGMTPPSPYQSIDTLKVARRHFKFTSNRLDSLGDFLGVGRKMDTGGFELWREVVLDHNQDSFNKMVDYCIQDVWLLEEVYDRLRPWDKKHPSLVAAGDLSVPRCNVCGGVHVTRNGTYTTNTQTYQRYRCGDCGHTMRSRLAEKKTREQRANLLRSI